ncbi:uncharacterized protein BO88DRAFT_6219 [Aspergillus vadensis CBS 113365]|uniref:Uncharacterized protein n=1 Tax=Aspergillus vadensis (strain CBS 113365 / IMI 142717 / IBT 24658) TaxID=1448311 RepID=A0A319BSM4_ASPVC|nr:hypothetical protein BO88DRAFT_6219 [Aspergillus vadensis CBS 113365]PYH74250.1 hypothetical protein BO88DRAFT_6219 [Aspergillus vadensis CBS 113365]
MPNPSALSDFLACCPLSCFSPLPSFFLLAGFTPLNSSSFYSLSPSSLLCVLRVLPLWTSFFHLSIPSPPLLFSPFLPSFSGSTLFSPLPVIIDHCTTADAM